MNDTCGLLVNSSRGIIFKSSNSDFDFVAGLEAKAIQIKMSDLLRERELV